MRLQPLRWVAFPDSDCLRFILPPAEGVEGVLHRCAALRSWGGLAAKLLSIIDNICYAICRHMQVDGASNERKSDPKA